MRIAVNTRFLLKSKMEGFGWYTYETISRIVKDHPEHQFIFLFDRPFDPKFVFSPNVEAYSIGLPARRPVLFKLWFDHSVTRALKKYKADLFISPDGYLSLKTDVPSIAVIHDLNFEHHPEDLPGWATRYYKKYFPLFARKAKRIVTVSEYSKNDICKTYDIAPDKITVGYNGASESIRLLSEQEITATRNKITNGLPYFIFIGALSPRKNLGRLFKAFDAYYESSEHKYPLVIVGEKYFWNDSIKKSFDSMKNRDKVIFTGHLNREELNLCLGASLALTFVSYFEGFGIPLVEAMKCHVPIITSDKTSLPEIAGDAALICDPFSVESIKEKLMLMANNESVRRDLIEKGIKRSESFSWDKTAEILWDAIITTAHAEGKI